LTNIEIFYTFVQIYLLTMKNLITISDYAKLKDVHPTNVHYWIKKKYLTVQIVGGKKFIDKKQNPIKIIK